MGYQWTPRNCGICDINMPQFHMSDRFLRWYDILNIYADGTTTRYGMRIYWAFWVIEIRYWQDHSRLKKQDLYGIIQCICIFNPKSGPQRLVCASFFLPEDLSVRFRIFSMIRAIEASGKKCGVYPSITNEGLYLNCSLSKTSIL